MKKIVFIAIIISFAFSLPIASQQAKNEELERLAMLEREFAIPFIIPEQEELSVAEDVYPLLLKAAQEAGVNLFRPARYYRPDMEVEIQKYLLMTGETRFFDYIDLANGRMLKMEETQKSGWFLSSVQTKDQHQVGQLSYFDPDQRITIRSLQDSYHYLPVNGRYYVEGEEEQYQLFLNILSKELNRYLNKKNSEEEYSYTPADFQPPEAFVDPPEGFFILENSDYLEFLQHIFLFVTLLLLVYYIFNQAKEVGIHKMHGVSNGRLWWMVAGRLITMAVAITALGSFLFATVMDKSSAYLAKSFLQLGQAYLLFMGLSLLCYVYISIIKVSQTLKNRRDTRGIFVLNILLKVVCAVALLLVGIDTFKQYTELRAKEQLIHKQQGELSNWKEVDEYGLVEAYVGHTTAFTWEEYEAEQARGDTLLYKLYSYLSSKGALYINAQEYEEMNLLLNQNFSGIRAITVNTNYLRSFPINDEQGKPVDIPDESDDWILLVPKKYTDREGEIRAYFEQDEDIRRFYLTDDRGQELKIIWLANDQYIFSFNPHVFPREKNKILDPIIFVKTQQNHLFTYRGGIQGKGLSDPLKVRLINKDPERTLKELMPGLKPLQLDDRIKIVTLQESLTKDLALLSQEIKVRLLTLIGIFAVLLFVILQNLLIFFHKHQKEFIVKRLFGIGFFKTYRSVLGWFLITSVAVMMITLFWDQIKGMPEYMWRISGITDPHFLASVLILFGLEILATIIAMIIIERRNKIKVIKGGDS